MLIDIFHFTLIHCEMGWSDQHDDTEHLAHNIDNLFIFQYDFLFFDERDAYKNNINNDCYVDLMQRQHQPKKNTHTHTDAQIKHCLLVSYATAA